MNENPNQNDSPENAAQDQPQLSDEEREMLEQQMREVRVEDLLTQTVASVLNLSARRIVKDDEVDLDQARIGIEAVRALVPLLGDEVAEAIREPLSQVQMLYAQRSGGEAPGSGDVAGDAGAPGGGTGPGGPGPAGPGPSPGGPGSGGSGLWTPGGS